MYCKICGKELPDDAIFCIKCGKPQKVSENIEIPEYDTCEIVFSVRDGGRRWSVSRGKSEETQFWAKAIGSKGSYNAGESKYFEGHRPPSTIYDDKKEWKEAQQALDELLDHLAKNGWEYLGTFGEWYEKRFRRKRVSTPE